jgi:hypothetical protein
VKNDPKTIHILIDGDWILYAAGFAGQKNVYTIRGQEPLFDSLTAAREAGGTHETIFVRTDVDELSHVLHSAKLMLNKAIKAVSDKWPDLTPEPIVYIDGDGNFRSRLATIVPYKGNRHPASKPILYNEIREYLLKHWHARVVYDIETDDALAIAQTTLGREQFPSIIVGVDKDLLQVPGWHYNPNKGFVRISPAEARWRLMVQTAAGDATDNIKGAYRVGIKKASDAIPKNGTAAQQWDAVLKLYADSMEKHGNALGWTSSDAAATENFRLVYLLREIDEVPEQDTPALIRNPSGDYE